MGGGIISLTLTGLSYRQGRESPRAPARWVATILDTANSFSLQPASPPLRLAPRGQQVPFQKLTLSKVLRRKRRRPARTRTRRPGPPSTSLVSPNHRLPSPRRGSAPGICIFKRQTQILLMIRKVWKTTPNTLSWVHAVEKKRESMYQRKILSNPSKA